MPNNITTPITRTTAEVAASALDRLTRLHDELSELAVELHTLTRHADDYGADSLGDQLADPAGSAWVLQHPSTAECLTDMLALLAAADAISCGIEAVE